MPGRRKNKPTQRRGAIAVLAALLSVFMIIIVAFALDLGWLYVARTEAQAAADSAALAAVSELATDARLKGEGLLTTYYKMRTKARDYGGTHNKVHNDQTTVDSNWLNLSSGDIVIGQLHNPSNFNESLDLSNPFDYNAITVRVRRTHARNSPIDLMFTRIMGIQASDVSAEATAIYEDGIRGFHGNSNTGNSTLMPFAVDVNDWNNLLNGVGPDTWRYDSNSGNVSQGTDTLRELSMFPGSSGGSTGNSGNGGGNSPGQNQISPGNWGTVDIGTSGNSTNHLRDLIRHGPTPQDLGYHGSNGLNLDPASGTLDMTGNTGVSVGMEQALADVIGEPRTIFLYDQVTGSGNTSVFRIVGFAGIRVVDYDLTGGNKYIMVQPAIVVDPTAVTGGNGQSHNVYQPVHLVR